MVASKVTPSQIDSALEIPTMSVGDSINYILFTNPISSATLTQLAKAGSSLNNCINSLLPAEKTKIIKMDPEPLWKLSSSSNYFVRMAGVSGAMAVGLGAYGAHKILQDEKIDEQRKKMFEIANRYHFFHSLALLGVPLTRYPALSGSLFVLGLTMFCGSCYYGAMTGDNKLKIITPLGGTCFIFGWLAMAI